MKQIIFVLISLLATGTISAKKTFIDECRHIEGAIIETLSEEQAKELSQNGEDISLGDNIVDISGFFVDMITNITVVSTNEDDANKRLLKAINEHFSEKKGYELIANGSNEGIEVTVMYKKHHQKRHETIVFGKNEKDNKTACCIIFSSANMFDMPQWDLSDDSE